MDEPSRRARAALALAAALFALALADGGAPTGACPAPHEAAAQAGRSVALACEPGAGDVPLRGPARRLVGLPLDPNSADAATLETLPGIGPARALAIVEARARQPFARIAELERVPGIGPRTLAGVAGLLAIGGAEPEAAPPGLGPSCPERVGCPEASRSLRRDAARPRPAGGPARPKGES